MSQRCRLFPLLLLSLALSACATHRPRKKAAATALMAAPRLIGSVSLVNDDLRFALVDSPEMPIPGTALKTFSQAGQETAVLSVGKEQKRPFIIADIVKGEPHTGDQVFQ